MLTAPLSCCPCAGALPTLSGCYRQSQVGHHSGAGEPAVVGQPCHRMRRHSRNGCIVCNMGRHRGRPPQWLSLLAGALIAGTASPSCRAVPAKASCTSHLRSPIAPIHPHPISYRHAHCEVHRLSRTPPVALGRAGCAYRRSERRAIQLRRDVRQDVPAHPRALLLRDLGGRLGAKPASLPDDHPAVRHGRLQIRVSDRPCFCASPCMRRGSTLTCRLASCMRPACGRAHSATPTLIELVELGSLHARFSGAHMVLASSR